MALSPRFDRDAFHSLPTRKAAQATLKALSAIQSLSPEEQVAGLAAAFLFVTERYRTAAQDAFAATVQMINHHDERGRTDFEAVRSYLDADVFRTRPNSPQDRF